MVGAKSGLTLRQRWVCRGRNHLFNECKATAKFHDLRQRKATKLLLQQRRSSTRARISGVGAKRGSRDSA